MRRNLTNTITAGLAAAAVGAGMMLAATPASAMGGNYEYYSEEGYKELYNCSSARFNAMERLPNEGKTIYGGGEDCHLAVYSRTVDRYAFTIVYK